MFISSIRANKRGVEAVLGVMQSILRDVEGGTGKGAKSRVVLLDAEVGVGKTFLVSKFARLHGINSVSSPSFSFINEYISGTLNIYHYDLYLRQGCIDTYISLVDHLFRDGYHFIEWGDEELQNKLSNFGINSLRINIRSTKGARMYSFWNSF